MKRRSILTLVGTSFLFGWWMLEKSGAVASERPTVGSVIEGLKRANDGFFQSGKLTFRYARINTTGVATKTKRPAPPREWLLGRDDGGWYTEAKALNPGLATDKKIALPRVTVLKNGLLLDWKQFSRQVFLGPKEVRNFNVLYGWEYLENAGVNPYRPVVESTGMSFEEATAPHKTIPPTGPESGLRVLLHFLSAPSLPEFLENNAPKYSVAERSESIDGEACWVIEWPKMDKIWVDVDRGCAVRRRVYHWKPAGPLWRQVDNSDFREVKPGLWFCFRQTVETYGRPSGDEPRSGKVVNRSTYEVSELDLSRAPDALINVRLPIGTVVTDSIRGIRYTVSDERGDPFEKPLGEARQAASAARRTDRVWPIIIANVAAVVLIALILVLRRKKAAAAVLIALLNMAAGATAKEYAATRPMRDQVDLVDDKGEWSWKPAWLERNACGPNSLFVLLKLLGKSVSLEQVKDLVRCDPVLGCSMGDLSHAASALGVSVDVRFIRPNELAAVPVPYILHGISGLKSKTGHFIVVVARDGVKHGLATIDPMRESFQWNPESGFVSDFSGYILVPRRHSIPRSGVLLALGLTLLSIGLARRYGDERKRVHEC